MRILRFPDDCSLGTLYSRPKEDDWRGEELWWPNSLGSAQGNRTVPYEQDTQLWAVSGEATADPRKIECLDPAGQRRRPTGLVPLEA